MTPRAVIATEHAPASPLFSQAIVCNGMVYVSGSIGMDKNAKKMVEGSVGNRTVGNTSHVHRYLQPFIDLMPYHSDKPSQT
jgi:enamine deaminase RidA (YjgF/YER057c/UK114 family)